MEEQLISFETAKLAKENGFDVKVYAHWYNHGNSKKENINNPLIKTECNCPSYDCGCLKAFDCLENYNHNEWGKCYFSAPTQSLLQKWLREEHNIHIIVHMEDWDIWKYSILGKDCMAPVCILQTNVFPEYKSYEEALEKALLDSLNLI